MSDKQQVGRVTFQNGLVPPETQGQPLMGGGQEMANWRWLIGRVEALERRVAELEKVAPDSSPGPTST